MKNEKVTMSSVEWLQAIELERDLTLADWNKAKENGSKSKTLPTKISTKKYVEYQD